MVEKTIQKILAPAHYWRDMNFDELSELYVAVLMRALAVGLIGLFIPLYMLKLGYGITSIIAMFACFFTTRIVADIAAGYTVARIGPKHTMIVGCLLQIASLGLFVSQQQYHWPLWLLGAVWGMCTSFYFIPFSVDFSKVKHRKHGGKELSYVNIMERIGATLGPVVGGVIASVFGAQYTFYLAIIVLVAGLVPLFRSAEPVRIRQKLDYQGFDISKHMRDYVSVGFLGIENTLSLLWWPLYLGVFILVTRSAYAKLGVLLSLSVLFSILVARAIGRRVDKRQGRHLLRINSILNAFVHLIRPFVQVYPTAVATNIANEVVTVGYRLPYLKGMYDAADDVPGYRIVYISSMESFASIVKATLWWLLTVLSIYVTGKPLFTVGFVVAAFASLGIMSERYKALNQT